MATTAYLHPHILIENRTKNVEIQCEDQKALEMIQDNPEVGISRPILILIFILQNMYHKIDMVCNVANLILLLEP